MTDKRKAHPEIVLRFARRVRSERETKGVSQEKLADAAGVHRTYVGGLERGEINPTLSNADKVARALNVELADLLRE